MTRRIRIDDVFLEAYDYRVKILDLLSADACKDPVPVFEAILDYAGKVQECIGYSNISVHYQYFQSLVIACKNLAAWGQAIRSAEPESSRYQKAFEIHAKDAGKLIKEHDPSGYFSEIVNEFLAIDSSDRLEEALNLLRSISLPLPVYWKEDRSMRISRPRDLEEKEKKRKSSTVYMSFKIDGQPVNNPQIVEPNQFVDLEIEVRVNEFPDDAEQLVIRPVADIAPANHEMPDFSFQLTKGKSKYSDKRRMKINFAQSYESMPIEFTYQAYFLPEEKNVNSIVNNVIKIRSDAVDSSVFCGYEEAKNALKAVRLEIQVEKGLTVDQKKNFLLIMRCLANIAGQALQNNEFPENISEEEFKKSLRQRLSSFPEIGSDLQTHSQVAAGITDLVFRKTSLELKVENKKNLSINDIKKYVQQNTAYTAGLDNRLGVLCVLDCSDKNDEPSGSISNDIGILKITPASSVVENPLPTMMGLVIIRGNLIKPSAYSR